MLFILPAKFKQGILILRLPGIFILVLACPFFNYARAADDHSGLITVMTYNIRVGAGTAQWGESPYKLKDKADLDLQPVAAAIESVHADVVGLQEVYGRQQAEQLGQLLNMAVAYVPHGQGKNGGWWGVALMSRFKILDVQRHEVSQGWGNIKSILVATLEIEKQPVVFIIMHKDRDLKDGQSFVNTLKAVENKASEPMVLLGDLNILPGDRRHSILSRKFTDTALAVETSQARFVRQRGTVIGPGRKSRGIRIDYVLVNRRFDVDEVGLIPEAHWSASDHLGYFARIKLRNP